MGYYEINVPRPVLVCATRRHQEMALNDKKTRQEGEMEVRNRYEASTTLV